MRTSLLSLIALSTFSHAAAASPSGPARSALARIAEATGRIPLVSWRAGRDRPSLVAGRLSVPLAGRPQDVAATFLGAHPELVRAPVTELRPERVDRVQGGAVIRYRQWHRGLPVFNGTAAVMVDDTGVVRSISASTWSVPPQDLTPTLDAAAALLAARAHAPVSGLARPAAPRLGLYGHPGGVRLVYRVDLPAVLALLSAPTIYLDAHDGRLVRRVSRIRFAKRAKAFLPNPVVTPTAQEVQLSWLGDGAITLENARILSLNCIDNHNLTRVAFNQFAVDVHLCDEIHKARADSRLDFLFDPVAEGTAPQAEDEFAEVQMFYHANRIYDFYTSLGFSGLVPSTGDGPLQATVNFRIPIDTNHPPTDLISAFQQVQDPNGPLYPFDNAFFVDAASASQILNRERDSMVFGQGTLVDFAYDGDVIYHEFGHAVVASTARLGSGLIDEFGLDSAPGAMNEGYADYFAAALSGDPNIGDYAGRALPAGQAAGAIRTLTNADVCPNHLWGEVHQDSQAFSAGLWQARMGVAENDRATYDAAVFAALVSLSSEASFEDAATATAAAVQSRLGATAAGAVRTALESRGLFGCNDRIVDYAQAGPRRLVFVEGRGSVDLTPYVPGYFQIRFEVPAGKNEIVVTYALGRGLPTPESLGDFFGGGSPDLRLLVARDQPIIFQYEGQSIANTGDFVEVRPRDTGTTTPQGAKIFEARYSEGVTPGVYYLMLVNAGQIQGVASRLDVAAAVAASPADAGTPSTDGGAAGADGGPGPTDGGAASGTRGGCGGCDVGGAPSSAGLLLGILALLVAHVRRRRA